MRNTYYNLPRWGKRVEDFGSYELDRLTTIQSLIPEDVKTILDIGCGDGMICNPLKEKYDIVGVDVSRGALVYVKTKKMQASAAHLPFKKNSFDLVLLSDVLEHLPGDILEQTIKQIPLVSRKYVLVNVPNEEDLFINTIICPKCKKSFHINWHMRNFDKNKVLRLFPELKFQIMKYCGLPRSSLIGFLIKTKRIFRKNLLISGIFTTCPFCNYVIDRRTRKNELKISNMKICLKKITINFLSKFFTNELSEIVVLLKK